MLSVILILFAFNIVKINYTTSIQANEPDYWPINGWVTSTPEEENMNPVFLEDMLQYIEDEGYSIDSILLIRNGYLVFERYFNGWNETAYHNLFSVTKSVMSCLIGIAIEEELLQLNQTMISFFSDRVIDNLDYAKQNITIEHLLTMSSGLDWIEAIHSGIFTGSDDPLQYVLDRPMVAAPGEVFNYNTGVAHMLSAILQNVTSQTTLSYASEKIFDLLGIDNLDWTIDPQGVYFGGHGLSLAPRDMAKFGFLYLNNGTWNGSQIISEDWVRVSNSKYNYTVEGTDYGYLWWLYPKYESYSAEGFLGQIIHIIPKYDFIVVVTSSALTTRVLIPILLSDYLLPSINEYPYTPPTTHTDIASLLVSVIPTLLFVIQIKNKRSKRNQY